MSYRPALAAVATLATVVALVAPAPAAAAARRTPVAETADDLECAPYFIIGLRGSGQTPSDGPMDMGPMTGVYAQEAYDNLPAGLRNAYALPYPAAPVGLNYFDSVAAGVVLLQTVVRRLIVQCPGIHIGLIGYSQGAHVINETLRELARDERDSIWAVLLLADPLSGGDSFYDRHSSLGGGPGTHTGIGILGQFALRPDIQGRATDFCISADPVCDAPETKDLGWIIEAAIFLRPLHSEYPRCCGNFVAREVFGLEHAQRLLSPLQNPPSQCQITLAET